MQLSLYVDDCFWRNSKNMRFARVTRLNFKTNSKTSWDNVSWQQRIALYSWLILRCKRRKANITLEIHPLRPVGQRMVEDCPVILLSFIARSEMLLCRKGHKSFCPFFPLFWQLLLRLLVFLFSQWKKNSPPPLFFLWFLFLTCLIQPCTGSWYHVCSLVAAAHSFLFKWLSGWSQPFNGPSDLSLMEKQFTFWIAAFGMCTCPQPWDPHTLDLRAAKKRITLVNKDVQGNP